MPSHYDLESFSTDYFDARDKFLSACSSQPGHLRRFQHSLLAGDNQPLSTEVFWLGEKQVSKVLVIISATHGVEGFCGSAAQINWLRHAPMPTGDTAVLFVHALNPFGFAHLRRVNEDNVDLNRNFIDFSDSPVNLGYRELADVLLPEHWSDANEKSAMQTINDYRKLYGQRKTEEAVSSGQYEYPQGLFYGGATSTWSRQVVETVMREFDLVNRQRVAVVDIHSGLGPYGYGEVISDHPPGSKAATLAKRWFGDSVTEPALGTSTSVPKLGLLDYAWHKALGDRGCYITLEFGTYSLDTLFQVLRKENYFWHRDPETRQLSHPIRQQIRDYFYPDKKDWQEMVLFRSEQVLTQALDGLAGND
ncbi:MAG: M14 family metallopeptidase [Gammaproteobacteria bacterium]|nr:M14 family metallopeptidase [Gammaproteobacteria bacterium]